MLPTISGMTARYQCDNNSILIGNSIRRCSSDGSWSGSSPSCERNVNSIQ